MNWNVVQKTRKITEMEVEPYHVHTDLGWHNCSCWGKNGWQINTIWSGLQRLPINLSVTWVSGNMWPTLLHGKGLMKNLVRDALGLCSDYVHQWRLWLEEYNPEIVYIKVIDNTVADAISHLEYDPDVNARDSCLEVYWVQNWALVK